MIFSILIVFVIRFLFAFLPSFGFDMASWLGWAHKLAAGGFATFYSLNDWTQYTPGYLYYLWLIGKIGWVNELAIKIPIILADIITGLLIYWLVKKINKSLAVLSFFLYTLNPVVIFGGSVWGQIDGILTLFLFLSAYFLIEKESLTWSVFFWTVAFLIKPQAIAILPAILMVLLVKKVKWKETLSAFLVGCMAIFIFSLPFFPGNPILGLPQLIVRMSNFYSCTSVNAFNIWSWVGFWQPDTQKFLGLTLFTWGTIFLIISISIALFVFRKKLNLKANYYLLFAILSLCFFLFPTRVHERYIFPFFAFLLTAAGLSKSRKLIGIYIVTSIASFLNLYYPYSYYYPTQLRSDFLYNLSASLAKLIGFIFLVTYLILLWWEKLPKFGFSLKNKVTEFKLPKVSLSRKTTEYLLLVILVFAFITRVFALGNPPNEYFDEVYHAFTARVILHGDPKAWEWWNTPPAGFAYEWTHPPLAKLGMVLGMLTFGENSFGWRIPGALLGVGCVYLVYLLGKEIFSAQGGSSSGGKDEVIGLLSAAVFSLDGLALVMSRIGMNDIYILFFALLSIYFFLKEKDFVSAAAFGLAIASKWSAIWVVPILFILWLKRKNKFRLSTFACFLLLPFTIYLLTYTPMFLTGHSLSVWWEMQKQMWWYHTGLRATHPYSSSWWSWPFMARPIYLYTSEEISGAVARIYAMGNPLVFWAGLVSLVLCAVYAVWENNKKLGLIIFSYLIFFVPWAASPRIMFLYHYLPSIPFMCIAIGYVLRRNSKLIFPFLVFSLLAFIYFYPHWAGFQIPLWLDRSYYWFSSWR
jgi:dolichyl-phosphate-mannose-protein mannosyltransferase